MARKKAVSKKAPKAPSRRKSAGRKSARKKKSGTRGKPEPRSGKSLSDHFIVCGAGGIGRHVVEDLARKKLPLMIIERNEAHIAHIEHDLHQPLPRVIGDASDDKVLEEAGIQSARCLITTFDDDKINVFVTLSARRLNKKLRIISRAVSVDTVAKLKRAGASSVVSTNFIGGMRVASEMIRPHVVDFLDLMLKRTDRPMKIEEVVLGEVNDLTGRRLVETGLREEMDILVMAVRDADSGEYLFNPPGERRLKAGDTLVVMGHVDAIRKLRASVK